MKRSLLIISLASLLLTSCAGTRAVGGGLQKAAVVTAEAGLYPAVSLADSNLHGLIRGPLAVFAAVPAFVGVVVAVPLWAAGTLMKGTSH